jgi:hypothetical protein
MLVTTTSPIPSPNDVMEVNKDPKRFVTVDILSGRFPPEVIVDSIASIPGELEVYTWYEGPKIIRDRGAQFLTEKLFEPLYRLKSDIKLYLYSLEAWNFQRNVDEMDDATLIGDIINSINTIFVKCIYASSFFKFCTEYNEETPLYRLLNGELDLSRKQWLVDLSKKFTAIGKTVEELLGVQPTLVDCIKEWDVKKAYSTLQYVEGFYLIREAVTRGLIEGKKEIQVAFMLPNDEEKYYRDLPDDIEKMLKAEFGEQLNGLEKLKIYFRFYEYGEKMADRPYLGPETYNVPDLEIGNYFNYLPANQGV